VDGIIDGRDFLLWNANKNVAASAAQSASASTQRTPRQALASSPIGYPLFRKPQLLDQQRRHRSGALERRSVPVENDVCYKQNDLFFAHYELSTATRRHAIIPY
jgi:hypothetical protein